MTVLTTSIPQVIDAVLALTRSLDLRVNNDPVQVFDGFPGPQTPDYFIQIGGVEPTTVQGTQEWHSLGAAPNMAPARDEDYTIDCYSSAYIGGVDAGEADPSDAQATARTTAFALIADLEAGLRTNPKLLSTNGGDDGLLPTGLGTGWVSFGGSMQLDQTTGTDPEAGKGRRAVVKFEIGIYKRLFSN